MSIDDLPLSELVKRVSLASVGATSDEDDLLLSELVKRASPASVGVPSDDDAVPLEYVMEQIQPTGVLVHVCLDDVSLDSINKTAVDLRWECLTHALLKGGDSWRQKLRQIASN